MKEKIKEKLLSRGFEELYLQGSEKLINAVIEEVQSILKNNTDIVTTVPYQLCPKCQGTGEVYVQNWYGSPTSIFSGVQTCNICGGRGIIPMHVIDAKDNWKLEIEK